MKMTTIIRFLVPTFLAAASCLYIAYNRDDNTEDDSWTSYEHLVAGLNKEIEKNFGLKMIGSGGAFMHGIEKIVQVYKADRDLSIEEARLLIVEVSQLWVNTVNIDEGIRSFIRDYPLDLSDFCISVHSLHEISAKSNHIANVMLRNSIIHYCTVRDSMAPLEAVCEESYEKALTKAQNKSLKKEGCARIIESSTNSSEAGANSYFRSALHDAPTA